jgi:hypothetical protein
MIMLLQPLAAGRVSKGSIVDIELVWRVPFVGVKQRLRAGGVWHSNDAGRLVSRRCNLWHH